jgi:hypothetical protein
MTKKKIVISPSLTQWRRSREKVASPKDNPMLECQKAS